MTLPFQLRAVGRFALVAVAYFLISLFGVAFVVQPEQLSVFWPGGGVVTGFLLLIDRRQWLGTLAGVFVGNMAGNAVHGHTLAVSSGFAAVNTVEPLVCSWLLLRVNRPRFRFDSSSDVGWLFLIPMVVCSATALVGTGLVTAGLGSPSYWSVWKVWWLADALGVVLFSPLVLVWGGANRSAPLRWAPVLQSGLLLGALGGVEWAIYLSDLPRRIPLLSLPYPIIPLLLFVALQSGLRGITLAVAMTGILAARGTLHGVGPVSGLVQSVGDQVLLTQGFTAVIALSSLVLASAIRERRAREREVGELNRVLTERVREAETVSAALRESEKRFQAIFHAQFQFIGLMSPDGTLLEANRTALAAAGATEREVIGKRFWDTMWWTHDPVQQDRLRAATATAAGGERVRFEASHPTADGGLMWVDFSITPFRDESGRVTLLIPEGREISDLKRAEVRLRESEERFELAVRGSQDGIWDWHIQTGEAYFSPRWKGMLGYAEGELDDHFKTWERLIHPDDVPRATAALTAYFDGAAATYAVEIRMRHKEGGYRWIFTRGVAVRDGDGRPYRMAGSHTDITARKAAEETLRHSEERFRAAMEGSLHAVYFLEAERGPDGHIADFRFAELNGRGADLIARPREEMVGRRLCELIPINRTGGFFEKYVRVAETGEPLEEEFPIGQADGITASWLHHQVVRVGDGVVVTSQDVTARKASEEALRASEERYRSVVGALAEGIVLQNESGEIVAFNDRARSILGLSHDRLGGRTSQDPNWQAVREDGQPFPGDEHPAMVALRTGRPVFDVVMGVERPSRERVWLSVNAVPFGEGARQVVASFHDVTEARRLNERLLTALREKDVMLREIHHRVKNNLAVIASLFQLQSGYTADETIRRVLQEAQDRVRSMALVHEYLYNSADLAAVQFGEYTRTLAEQLFRSYRLPGAAVSLALDVNPMTLSIDQAVPCGLVLNELMSNGLKHAFPNRGGTLTVALGADTNTCLLRVTDDGVGIPTDRFEGRPRSLGLRLIRTLARQLNGHVEFRPADPGTEVRLSFPIRHKTPGVVHP